MVVSEISGVFWVGLVNKQLLQNPQKNIIPYKGSIGMMMFFLFFWGS